MILRYDRPFYDLIANIAAEEYEIAQKLREEAGL